MASSTSTPLTFDSCHLTRAAYPVNIKESHPMWTKIRQDSYLVEVRLTRRNFQFMACLHGYSQLELASPAEEQNTRRSMGFAIPQHELAHPSQLVSKLLQELCLHLQHSERRYLTHVIDTFRSKIGPGTTTMAVIDISVCHTEVIKTCIKKKKAESESICAGMCSPEHDFTVDDRIRTRVEQMWTSWILKRSEDLKHHNGLVRVRYEGAGEETCSVCLDEFQKGNEIARTACCHYFHKTCITFWTSRLRNCPLCRTLVEI